MPDITFLFLRSDEQARGIAKVQNGQSNLMKRTLHIHCNLSDIEMAEDWGQWNQEAAEAIKHNP